MAGNTDATPAPRTQLILPSLRGDHIANLFRMAFDPAVDVAVQSRALSSVPGDTLPDARSAKVFLQHYFLGSRAPIRHQVTLSDVEGLSPIEAFDLFYRSGTLGGRETWVVNRISHFIDSHRVFAVAALIGHRKVMDCFLEIHGREWFGVLGALVPAYDDATLAPTSYKVSAELSAKSVGTSYFLHAGTNAWNRAWLPTTRWDTRWDTHIRNWSGLVAKSAQLADTFGTRAYQFLFVPEKDTLTRAGDPGLFQSGLLPMLSMMELMNAAPKGSVLFPVLDLVREIDPALRLRTPDSHLSGQDYWLMFCRVMERFGLSHAVEDVDIAFDMEDFVGDLSSKFGVTGAQRQVIRIGLPDARQTYGEPTLQLPLRTNHVVFTNPDAPVKRSLLLLGDSHSSVGGNPFLTYIARHFFRDVEFAWSPFNVHNYPADYFQRSQYDYLLCETSQRFSTPTAM